MMTDFGSFDEESVCVGRRIVDIASATMDLWAESLDGKSVLKTCTSTSWCFSTHTPF